MQTHCFANLLFNEVIAIAAYLEIVLDPGVHCYNSLSNRHLRLFCFLINTAVHIKLVENEDFFAIGSALEDTKE